jgi:hypothetical protein
MVQQTFLRPKVIVDGRQVDPGFGSDVSQRSSGIPLFSEQPFRSVQDLVLGVYHLIQTTD